MARVSPTNANEIIEEQLDIRAGVIEKEMNADVLGFVGGLVFGADDVVRTAVEAKEPKRDKLVVVLETTGGFIEVVRRIVDVFRRHYAHVEFIIPNYALSAGTVLVLSGDAIYMDYYSILGPIDPQLERPDGTTVPALGYLVQYERLIEKAENGNLTTAEMTFLVEKFDPAELYRYEQQRELSISFLKEWLVKYKFKNWKETRTRGMPVTSEMRQQRAEEIAGILNETERWHSHGHGISIQVLRNDLNLEIEDFGEMPNLAGPIKEYHRLLADYITKTQHGGALHMSGRYVPLLFG